MKNYVIYLLFSFLLCWNPIVLTGVSGNTPEKVSLQRAEVLVNRLSDDPWLLAPGGSTLAWDESYTLHALMDLYEATKDTKYLEMVAVRGKNMLSHRDDKRGITDGSGESRPAWSVGAEYVVAEGALLTTTGDEILKLRSTVSAYNNSTTVEVIPSGDGQRFKLEVRNELIGRYETFNDLDRNFSSSYIINAINDPLAPYSPNGGTYTDQKSRLIRIEEVKTDVSGVLADQKISLTPIPLAFAGYVGVLYYPLMRFAEAVKNDPSLIDFIPDADIFIEAAEESYTDLSARLWRDGPNADEGYYLTSEKGESMPADHVGQPFNSLAKHVCTELILYRLTDKPQYLDRSTKMIHLFSNRLEYDSSNDLYIWDYWYEPMTTTGWGPDDDISYNTKVYPAYASFEDISHAGHNIMMVMAAYRAGIVFNETHVKRFANTFLKNVITPDRTKVTRFVDGKGDYQDYFNAIHQWFVLAELEPEVAVAGKEIYNNRTEETLPYTAKLLTFEETLDFDTSIPNADGVLFVKKDAVGNNCGDSWTNALPELADALESAKRNNKIKEIWVAKGRYKPLYSPVDLSEAGRENTFLLVKDVKIYGGFDPDAGISDLSHTRVLPGAGNPSPEGATVLSGDVDNDGAYEGNAYHVLVAAGDVGEALLDGFVITGGYGNAGTNRIVNGISVSPMYGAGIYNHSSSPKYVNVSIIANKTYATANTYGGGIYNNTGSPEFFNVHIADNEAVATGGANAVAYGGAVYSAAAAGNPTSPKFTNVCIVNNKASTVETSGLCVAGAMYGNNCPAILTNVLISGNSASSSSGNAQGGGLYWATAFPTLINVTVSGNTVASISGTPLNNEAHNMGTTIIRNSVIYSDSPNAIINAGSITANLVENSLVQGRTTTAANNNIISNSITGATALFTDPAAGDYTLKAGSPLIDKGNNSFFDLSLTATDLAGYLRIQDGTIDIGAFEFGGNIAALPHILKENALSVYPNPVRDVLYVRSSGASVTVVKIYSLQGVLALQAVGDRVDVSSLATGIYFVNINGERVKMVKK